MLPRGLNHVQYDEACRIQDMVDGPPKERAKRKWRERHGLKWPRCLFRGNPDVRDYCEKSKQTNDILEHPGHYLIDSLT